MFCLVLNISKEVDFTTSLSNLFQCLTIFTELFWGQLATDMHYCLGFVHPRCKIFYLVLVIFMKCLLLHFSSLLRTPLVSFLPSTVVTVPSNLVLSSLAMSCSYHLRSLLLKIKQHSQASFTLQGRFPRDPDKKVPEQAKI